MSRVRLRNEHGTPVDPVPFLVASLFGFTVSFSYGPIYLMELGFGLESALLVCGVVVAAVTAAAYHRYVWTARPDLQGEVPAGVRFRRLFYATFAGIAGLALLALPLLVR